LLFRQGAYWSEVSGDAWSKIVGPRSCPQEALSIGELEAWKASIKKSFAPALIIALRHGKPGQEFILASNIDATELLQTEAIGLKLMRLSSFFGLHKNYYALMDALRRRQPAQKELILQNALGESLPVVLDSYPIESEISLTPLAYCHILT
jgi:hypothetical protein